MEAGILAEAAAMPWRRRANQRSLAREGRIWTLWSVALVITFGLPGALLIWIQPLAFPVSAIFVGHAIAVLHLQARRGARGVKPIGGPENSEDRRALGLLGDLVAHDERQLLTRTGLALERGRLGAWLIGQEGAILVRPGGHRIHCFCVRVGEAGDLPPGDRVAHLLLALREDEQGFATVANRNFSGATWRLRLELPGRSRPALCRARAHARR
jgi:hypothetical protein